ncbi:hypothetical protein HPB47_004613 [Ixodes persulcatus]|uniref:Uncharacterized protein n=1 Tax=Ixodes persulcatus TaxID=34615 RepID=A0AC60PG54_IXOPE|nr:hypothetical protein HPB47_004613 [Ixodes persulcatus]
MSPLFFLFRYLTLFLIFLTATLEAGASQPEDLVPNLCNLIDQALYCRCDTDDITDDATEVTCYVVKDIATDDIVFKAFAKQPSIVSIVFSSLSEDHHLKFVPSDVLPHAPVLERLKFSQAELGVLKTHAFYNLKKLAELETDCISHLPHLKKLELADNKLKKMAAQVLSHLPSLTHLFLERNKMTVIEDFAFAGLGKVKELDLSDNSIQALTEHSFKGLSRVLRLDMFRNKLKRLEARVFGGLSSLVELDLKYNEISEVDPLAFDGLPHLTIVYLSFNRLRVLPAQMFMGAPNLVTVDLSQNQLVTLTWRTVQDLRKIDAESFDMSLTGHGLRRTSSLGNLPPAPSGKPAESVESPQGGRCVRVCVVASRSLRDAARRSGGDADARRERDDAPKERGMTGLRRT